MFKKLFSIVAILAVVMTVGCKKNQQEEVATGATTFTLAQTEISVSADGGNQSVKYTIKNAQPGAVVISNCSSSWIKELSTATVGEITFTVAPNYAADTREATIAVEYTAVDEKFEIKIQQAGSTKPMFEYEVVINEPTHLSLNVTPADLTTAYVCRTYTKDHIEAFDLLSDEALIAYDLEAIEYEADHVGQTLLNYLQNICHTGKGFDIEFTRLFPDTEYVVYCYHINLATGKPHNNLVYREVITTAKPTTEKFDVEMGFDISGAVITQTITPADKEVYYYANYWNMMDFYNYYGWDSVMEETLVTKWNESVTMNVQMGYQPYQIIENNCLKGDQTIVHDHLKAETDYVFYIFAVDKETGFAASDIIIVEKKTNKAHASNMTIDIEVKNIFWTTADVYWTASDPNGRFARSVMEKSKFEAVAATDDERLAIFASENNFWKDTGTSDINLYNLTPNTTYVAFAYGLDGESPNTRLFKKEFKTLGDDAVGSSNINISWKNHYNLAELAVADAEHWGSYAEYENHALVTLAISGANSSDDVYLMVTTQPIDYYTNNGEWLRDVAKDRNKVNCYSNYNFIGEYEKEYTVVAVAQDANGNYGTLFIEEMYLYKSDSKPASEYTYVENK